MKIWIDDFLTMNRWDCSYCSILIANLFLILLWRFIILTSHTCVRVLSHFCTVIFVCICLAQFKRGRKVISKRSRWQMVPWTWYATCRSIAIVSWINLFLDEGRRKRKLKIARIKVEKGGKKQGEECWQFFNFSTMSSLLWTFTEIQNFHRRRSAKIFRSRAERRVDEDGRCHPYNHIMIRKSAKKYLWNSVQCSGTKGACVRLK